MEWAVDQRRATLDRRLRRASPRTNAPRIWVAGGWPGFRSDPTEQPPTALACGELTVSVTGTTTGVLLRVGLVTTTRPV
jgi:hypothetical protein